MKKMNDLSFLDGVSLKQGFLLGVSENLMFGNKLVLFNVNQQLRLLKQQIIIKITLEKHRERKNE